MRKYDLKTYRRRNAPILVELLPNPFAATSVAKSSVRYGSIFIGCFKANIVASLTHPTTTFMVGSVVKSSVRYGSIFIGWFKANIVASLTHPSTTFMVGSVAT